MNQTVLNVNVRRARFKIPISFGVSTTSSFVQKVDVFEKQRTTTDWVAIKNGLMNMNYNASAPHSFLNTYNEFSSTIQNIEFNCDDEAASYGCIYYLFDRGRKF